MWDDPLGAASRIASASFARLILYDKRDQGLSDRLGRPPTLEESMDDLRAVMDAAGSERAALFGVSEGGPMCQLFAATFPERVTALVLYGTYARMVEGDGYDIGVPATMLDRLRPDQSRGLGELRRPRMFAPSLAQDERFRDYWARLLRSASSPKAAVALMPLYRQIDTRPALSSISAPTLVMHRIGRPRAPVERGRYLAEHIPEARFVELEGDDHLPMVRPATRSSTRSRSSSPARGSPASTTGCSPRCCSPTSSAPPSGRPSWATGAGGSCSSATTRSCAASSTATAAARSRRSATGSWPPSTARARRSACAQAIREGVRALGVEIRAGLHTGEVELIGDDVGGMAVHIGARVGAQAAPRGARLEHGDGPGGRLRPRLRRAGHARAEGRAGRVAAVRRGGLGVYRRWVGRR